jgi:hypothetical protein
METVDTKSPSKEEVLRRLAQLTEEFYWKCFRAEIGMWAHAFLEFNGLMSVYIECLREADVDPREVNVHSAAKFHVPDHRLEYLAEKLECIFSPILSANPNAREILSRHLFAHSPPMDSGTGTGSAPANSA